MIKVKIPTSLSEITLRQYKHFLKISEDVKSDNFMNAKMVEIFCSLKLAEVMKLEVNAVDEIVEMISKLFEQKPALVTRFELNGTDYGFHTSLDNMSLGEYIDLDNNIGDWPNIERAMNVLYRPVVSKLKEKYSIAEYEVGNEADILDMPMDAVLSSVFFLWNLGMELSQVMMNSLEAEETEVLTKFLNSQENGGGINQFTVSLTALLQDLNLSLN
jgi:hypothetical protein|tara:strand:- start:3647 stop:4294 length:648 start_codon:yes stop_codon:yes gene_type:complete